MAHVVEIKALAEHRDRYRDLLRSDWSAESLTGAADLFRDVLLCSGLVLSPDVNDLPVPDECATPRSYPIPPEASPHLAEFLETLNAELLSAMPSADGRRRSSSERSRLERDTERVHAYLTFPFGVRLSGGARISLRGEVGLLRDNQSLLYRCARYFLLPKLLKAEMAAGMRALVGAMHAHARLAWTDDIAQQAFLLALVYDFLAEAGFAHAQHAGDAYEAALRLTPRGEHVFLTRAHAYWFWLMDRGEVEKAALLLVSLAREVPPTHDAELVEMMKVTFPERPGRSRST